MSEEIPLLWMLAAHSGRPYANQTPPGSIQANPTDKLGTKVSIRQTAIRVTLIKCCRAFKAETGVQGWVVEAMHLLLEGGATYQLGVTLRWGRGEKLAVDNG